MGNLSSSAGLQVAGRRKFQSQDALGRSLASRSPPWTWSLHDPVRTIFLIFWVMTPILKGHGDPRWSLLAASFLIFFTFGSPVMVILDHLRVFFFLVFTSGIVAAVGGMLFLRGLGSWWFQTITDSSRVGHFGPFEVGSVGFP